MITEHNGVMIQASKFTDADGQVRRKAYIFDIDGTLSDTSRRRHHLDSKPKNWKDFFADQINDAALPTVKIACELHNKNTAIILVSGRGEEHRDVTTQWLAKQEIFYDELFMRPLGNHEDDDLIKEQIYLEHIKPYYSILAVFEDRKRIKKMWVRHGLFVFDCNQTDNDF